MVEQLEEQVANSKWQVQESDNILGKSQTTGKQAKEPNELAEAPTQLEDESKLAI